jgi:hypothetical protein
LAKHFDLKRDGGVQTFNVLGVTKILSDGYSNEELGKITVDGLQAITESSAQDFWLLVEMLVKQEEGTSAVKFEPPAPYCTECSSKGPRHLKICPKSNAKIQAQG